jgi:GNAT superfamily N-acetyltransferase
MTVSIRIAAPETDLPAIAALIGQDDPLPLTVEDLQKWEARQFEGQLRRWSVATDETDRIVGHASAVHLPWMPPGSFELWLIVDDAHRARGIGAQLWDDVLGFALANGATVLEGHARETCPEGIRFAQARGFSIDRHIFESELVLTDFDESRFAGIVEAVEATGIRFFSLADQDTPDVRHKLYEVNRRTALDIPGSRDEFSSFEEFSQIVFPASWFRAEGQILAADGDAVIGLSAAGYYSQTNSMYNLMTGVDRAYRGRGIAQALKLLVIRLARRLGASYVRTNNDSLNAAILAINRRLGYRPLPGYFRLIKHLT